MGLNNVVMIAKKVFFNSASLSAFCATTQAVAPTAPLQTVLVGGAWGSGGLALAAGTVWVAATAWERRSGGVPRAGQAEELDLVEIRRLAVRFFGAKVSSLDRMKMWASRHPGIFSVVTNERRNGSRKVVDIDGYFCALPLTKKGADELLAERCGINDLDADAICTPGAVPNAVYVGAVASRDDTCKGAALQGLRSLVNRMAKSRSDVLVLARPVTPDGLRLARYFGLQPVRTEVEDPLGVLHSGRLGQLALSSRRRK